MSGVMFILQITVFKRTKEREGENNSAIQLGSQIEGRMVQGKLGTLIAGNISW